MRGKILCVFCIVCLFLTSNINPVFAARRVLNVTAYKQEKSNWCWAASDQMVIKYCKSSAPTQSQIVKFIFGSADNKPATIPQIRSALTNWNVRSSSTSGALSFTQVQNNINSSCLIIVGLKGNESIGHMNVIRGYDTSNSKVLFADPSDGDYHAQSYSNYKKGYHYDGVYYVWQDSIYSCK